MNKADIIKQKIEAVEKEIRTTPYDKASEHHHGVLKAKLAKLKDQLEGPMNKGQGGGGGYAIKHSGDASVVLVGMPSVGKSTLLNAVTNAESKVGNYDFTTLGVVPGMMEYKGVKIQILDLPGIIEGAAGNKGFGRKVISVIRASDLVVLMVDANRQEWLTAVKDELYRAGIRMNTRPPKIDIQRMERGAIRIVDPYHSFDKRLVEGIAEEWGLDNAVIQFNEKLDNIDKFIDRLARNRKYMNSVEVITKVDLLKDSEEINLPKNAVLMSSVTNVGFTEFKEAVWKGLGLVRVYLRRDRSGQSDRREPLIVRADCDLNDVANKISTEMREDISRVYVWGEKVKYQGQEVSFSFPVFDEMEVWFGR